MCVCLILMVGDCRRQDYVWVCGLQADFWWWCPGMAFCSAEAGKERKEVKKRRKSWNVVPLSLGSKGLHRSECRAGFSLQIAMKENDDDFQMKVIKY